MAGWRKRIGRMGNHYANEAGLNHTVPMIICWEEPRLLGSLVCSMAGTHFCVFSLGLLLFSRFCNFLTYSFLPLLLNLHPYVYVALDLGSRVDTESTFGHGPSVCMYLKLQIIEVQPFSFKITAHNTSLTESLFYHNTQVLLDQQD